MAKILFYSNSPWASSGYSKCCNHIVYGLAKYGHTMGVQSNFGLLGGVIEANGVKHYPQGSGFSEQELFINYSVDKYDFIIAQYDLWVLGSAPNLIRQYNVVFCPYVPVDHLLISPNLKRILDSCFHIVSMCDYGEKLLHEAGYKNVSKIYHGVDTETYKISDKSKEECRTALGFAPNDFVVSMVQMNRAGRKDIPRQLEAISIFRQQNPDIPLKLYLHTLLNQNDGDKLIDLINLNRLQDITRTPPERDYVLGFSEEEMSRVYQGSDILLHASNSEGFGFPLIESMACGTPVIAGDTTSMTEILKPVTPEFLVKPKDFQWIGTIPAKVPTIDQEDIVKKLELAARTDLEKYKYKLSEYAKEKYDWKLILKQWNDFANHIIDRVDNECVKVPDI